MSTDAQAILANLQTVAKLRDRSAGDAALAARVQAIKSYQHARFERTYADLLADRRYEQAARFFLDELYGPHDFTDRDTQFARVVPALVRLFPSSVVHTVRSLAELHALSEDLDATMGDALGGDASVVDADGYTRAWRACGRRTDRMHQVDLMHDIGMALERFTRNAFLRHSLRMMRGPAQAAGLSSLQHFLETGFDAFRSIRGASEFLDTIAHKERALAAMLFDQADVADLTRPVVAFPWPAQVPVANPAAGAGASKKPVSSSSGKAAKR